MPSARVTTTSPAWSSAAIAEAAEAGVSAVTAVYGWSSVSTRWMDGRPRVWTMAWARLVGVVTPMVTGPSSTG